MSDNSVMSSYGHYQIVSRIGKGGMGAVYLANDTVLDRKVALKVLLPEVAQDKERIRRFIQEAKAVSALNHPNILTIFEIGEAHGTHYLVTELIDGDTLRDLIREGNIDVKRTIDVGIQTAAALGAAHRTGIIHRDIKPENVMVREDGLVKVLDFGLAKLAPTTEHADSDAATLEHYLTGPGVVVGTAAYMSPEQARGLEIDNRTDMFSLGTVMYELVTRRHPFPGQSNADVVSSILREDPAPVTNYAPHFPKQLEHIIEKLLRKDRDQRYQNIKDLQLDLEDLRDEIRFESKSSESKQARVTEVIEKPHSESFRSAFTSSIVVKPRFTFLHAILFSGLAIGVFVAFWMLWPRFFPPPLEPGTYPTIEIANWSSAAGELSTAASFSPDGTMIAYTSTRSGSANIWVTQTASQNSLQVTNDQSSNTDPIWSPKGDEIAFFSSRPRQPGSANVLGIWRVPALGGAPRLIGVVPKGNPELRHWTNSGTIYFQLDGNLYTLDAGNGEVKQITSFELNSLRWVDISSDGTQIAYLKRTQDTWSISISNIDTSNAVEVASGTGEVGSLVWSRNNERIYYSAKVGGVLQVFRSERAPNTSIRITSAETDCTVEDASPDGRSIIIGSAKEESNLWRISVADGKEIPLVKDLDKKLWPSTAPDDKRVTYQSARTMINGDKLFESSIMVKDMSVSGDAGRPREIAQNGFLPTWSANGEKIAFLRRAEKDASLVVIDADGGAEARTVATGIPYFGYSVSPYNPMYPHAFAWSPDNTSIVYTSKKSGASNLWMSDLAKESDQPLTNNSDTQTEYYSPFWSADGKWIAFLFRTKGGQTDTASVRGIGILDIATGQVRLVHETRSVVRLQGWISDGKQLLIAEASKEFASQAQETILRSVSVEGETVNDLAKMPSVYFFNIALSDDRKSIAFAGRDENADDIWILPVAGGKPRKLTANNDPEVYFSRLDWLRDGSAIVFGKQTRFSLLSVISEID